MSSGPHFAEKKPVLAVLDFDETITKVDSLLPFLRQTCGFWSFCIKLLSCSPALFKLKMGVVDNEAVKVLFLKRFLANLSLSELDELAKIYADGKLEQLTNPLAMQTISRHQAAGHKLVLLSASPENYLRPWAQRHGIDIVIGTRLQHENNRFVGALDGRNCHGEEKVHRLRAVFGDLQGYCTYAYGDSRSDLPVLQLATHPFYRSFAPRSLRAKISVHFLFLKAVLCKELL